MTETPEDRPPDTGAPHSASPEKRVSVLVVDDDDYVRSFMVRVLDAAGYLVDEATDGRVALKRFAAARPDLVITDLVMPEMEGLEFIRELRRRAPDLPILAISGGGRGDPRVYLGLAKQLGAWQTLEKPFDREALLAVLSTAPLQRPSG